MSRVLLFDIETSPLVSYTWGRWEQNVIDVKKEWTILTLAYKWLGGKTVVVSGNERAICKELWRLFDEADVVVGHNGDKFDIKKVNTRLAFYGLKPPSPYKTVDTLKVARRYFAFSSNSLNDLGKFFGLGEKKKHEGFPLWLKVMAGNKKALSVMKAYNKQDVVLLEKIYLKLLPWMRQHPNISDASCPKCNSTRLQARGTARSLSAIYQRYQCLSCGGWCRSNSKSAKQDVLLNI